MATAATPTPVTAPVAGMAAQAAAGNHPSGSLYVGDLHPEVTEALLFEIFNPVGPVSSIRVCRDSSTRRSLGYAYVNFHSADDAERALDTLNFQSIKGLPCRIMWSHRDPAIRKNSKANVFIKNLDKTIDNKELFDTFSQFGNILSCKVVTDPSGASQGYGFVHYQDEKDADRAIAEVNGKVLKSKKVFVAKHEKRQDRLGGAAGMSRYTNVYVKNIPEDWSEQKLKDIFAKFGTITSCVLKTDEEGKSKGFGFVNYETHEEAEKAVEEGSKISAGDDKTLFVDRFQKKAERHAILSKKHDEARREKTEKYKNLNLYVKNLDEDVDDAKLRELFEPFGEISSAIVMRDDKGVSKGFGFVCYANAEDATKAFTEMNSKMIGTKPIYVNRAERKEERRIKLESQFSQPMANARGMPMPMFYPPNMGMGQPMMYPPVMRGRMPMRPGYAQYNTAPQQRPRNPNAPRPMQGQGMPRPAGGAQQQKFRQGPNPRYAGRDMMAAPLPTVAAPVPAQAGGPAGDFAAQLAAAPPDLQKQMLGERLFPLVRQEQPELAGKITGMLLEMDVSEILELIDDQPGLKSKVAEAMDVLATYQQSKPE